jgi:hypothetical protein
LSRSREPPARSRTEQRRATPVLTVRPDRPYTPKKLGFHPVCEQQGVARSSNGNILRAPTPTHLPHPPHAKTPWLGSLEKRPSLFGPFTLHAVCSVGLHAPCPRCSSAPPSPLRTSRWLLGSALPSRCGSAQPPSTTQRWELISGVGLGWSMRHNGLAQWLAQALLVCNCVAAISQRPWHRIS